MIKSAQRFQQHQQKRTEERTNEARDQAEQGTMRESHRWKAACKKGPKICNLLLRWGRASCLLCLMILASTHAHTWHGLSESVKDGWIDGDVAQQMSDLHSLFRKTLLLPLDPSRWPVVSVVSLSQLTPWQDPRKRTESDIQYLAGQ